MMIPVVYSSGTHDLVKPEMLNRLLSSGEIAEFKRTTGWVKVGNDPIRQMQQGNYPGRFDRRHHAA